MGFQFGGVDVPLTPLVTRTGSLPATITGILTELGWTNEQLFEAGIDVGSTFSPEDHGQPIGSCSFTGGRTTLHDSTELIVTNPIDVDPTAPYPGDQVDVVVSHTEGQSTTNIYSETNFQITNPKYSTVLREKYTYRLIAIPYQYIEEDTEAKRRKGYWVYNITRYTVTQPDSTLVTQFWRSSRLAFDIPLWNKERGLDMYYDETPAPEPGEDPNDEGDPSDEGGGDGSHTPIYDPVPIPSAPTLGAANAGFITMYKLGLADINVFASDMFASGVWEAIKLFFSNPIDFLVGCMLLPFEPATGSSYHPKFGIVAFEHAYPAVSNQYKDVDCGSITINKYWGSCFDYEPYTKIQIWLPYIGYRELPVDEIMDMTVSVKYRCDCLTGDCVAFVHTGVVGQTGPQVERVIGQFYGNCGVRVPFGSVSYDSAVASSIQLIGAAATTGLSAGAGAMSQTGGAVGGLMAGADAVMTDGNVRSASIGVVQGLKPNVHKGGAAGASTGYMSIQKPYIIKRIPRQNLPANYMNLKGYPSNIGGSLSQFTGLAVVDDIQLNNIPAMEDERKEIIKWLRGGVLI